MEGMAGTFVVLKAWSRTLDDQYDRDEMYFIGEV
jgi:hypothetical protein